MSLHAIWMGEKRVYLPSLDHGLGRIVPEIRRTRLENMVYVRVVDGVCMCVDATAAMEVAEQEFDFC